MVTNLTKEQIENIQIDEGLIFLDYGEETETLLGPTRGGGEFNATANIRDIDFDGRTAKTAGTQVIEEQEASLKVNTICMSQENLALSYPGAIISEDKKTVKNPKCGLIPETAYRKNVTMFAKLIGGKYKKITINNPMHEGSLGVKAVPKGEGELGLELFAHQKYSDLNGDLWQIDELDNYPPAQTVSEANAPAQTAPVVAKTTASEIKK